MFSVISLSWTDGLACCNHYCKKNHYWNKLFLWWLEMYFNRRITLQTILKCYMINICVIKSKTRIFIYCHKNINAHFDIPANLNVFQYLILIKGVVTNQNSMHIFFKHFRYLCASYFKMLEYISKSTIHKENVYWRHYKTLYLYTRYFEMMAKVGTRKC